MPVPIMLTKLFIPATRPELVSRSRLIEQLDHGIHNKLTLISAPAGFGKTTLVTDWLQSQGDDASSPWDSSHSVTRVVLPNPAGAEMRVSLWFRPRLSCLIRWERETSSGREVGMKSLVIRSGAGINWIISQINFP